MSCIMFYKQCGIGNGKYTCIFLWIFFGKERHRSIRQTHVFQIDLWIFHSDSFFLCFFILQIYIIILCKSVRFIFFLHYYFLDALMDLSIF